MAKGLRFRIFGVPVHVDTSFFVIAVLLGLGGGTLVFIASWVLVVFFSVLLHEMAMPWPFASTASDRASCCRAWAD